MVGWNLILELKLTDLSERLSKLITNTGVHRDKEFTHMLKSRGKEGMIALCPCDCVPLDSDRRRVVAEEEVEVEVLKEVEVDEDNREGFD